ncbi:MAG: hypothetical protein HC828_10685 [Blastochloris sp.]|nr:hypothetical protein [Blastochloris sp.]
MRNNRFAILLTLLLAVMLSVSAVGAQDEPTQFAGGWPYQLPPDGHFNTFASGAILRDSAPYFPLMQPHSAYWIWSEGRYEPMLAESFGFNDDGSTYTLTLKDGVTWSNGEPVTSADVVATFNTLYLIGAAVWSDISSVTAVDDLTVEFAMTAPSQLAERRILLENIRPASDYGTFSERVLPLIEEQAGEGNADFDALLTELTEFRPETYVASGPYQLLAENISDASVTLTRNEGGLNSDLVRFDEILLWNGETEAVTPLVQNGELWYGTYGFPPASEQSFVDAGIDIIRGASYSGPAVYFNHDIYPLSVPEVRQALAYAINREENGFVSLGESGVANECMCGISDNLVSLWVSEDVQDQFDFYDHDPELATEILEGLGFSRGDDGVWVDDQGNRMSYELIFPAEFLDWAAAAENVTQQLNDFGIEITSRGVQFQQQQQDVYDSNFQIAIRNWGVGSPYPGQAYLQPYDRYNGQGEVAGEGVGGGMRFNPTVEYSGGTIEDVRALSLEAGQGLDVDAQIALIDQLALSYNELLPAIPLWERYGNNPLNREFLDAPASDDPIYNNAGADHFMGYLILTGGVGPAEG